MSFTKTVLDLDFIKQYDAAILAVGHLEKNTQHLNIVNQFLWNLLRGKGVICYNPEMEEKYKSYTQEILQKCTLLNLSSQGLTVVAKPTMENVFPGSDAVHPRNELFAVRELSRDVSFHVHYDVDLRNATNATLLQIGCKLGPEQSKKPLWMLDTHNETCNIRHRSYSANDGIEGQLIRQKINLPHLVVRCKCDVYVNVIDHIFETRLQYKNLALNRSPWKEIKHKIHIKDLGKKITGPMHVNFGQYLTNQIDAMQWIYVRRFTVKQESNVALRKREDTPIEDEVCTACAKHIRKKARLVYFLPE